ELFTLTSNFNSLKADNEETQAALRNTNDILEKTEIVLNDTKATLEEEETLRKAHEETEAQLYNAGTGLLSTLGNTVGDVEGLHAKIQRKRELAALNQESWQTSASQVSDVTTQIDARVGAFQGQHTTLVETISERIKQYVETELNNVKSGQSQLDGFSSSFDRAEAEATAQTTGAHGEMNGVLEEIEVLREEVKGKVGEGLNGLSAAAARISKEVVGEFSDFHAQLYESYSSLGKDLKSMFDNVVTHVHNQKTEISELRSQLQQANQQTIEANRRASSQLTQSLEEEHASAEAERDQLMSQMKGLMDESRQRQFNRLKGRFDGVRTDLSSSGDALEQATTHHDRHVDEWVFRAEQFAKDVTASRDEVKTKMQTDWEKTAESVHEETVRIVDAQIKDMDKQMGALDDFVVKARTQNGRFHEAHLGSLQGMATN
ncbi:Kinesin-related motor protein, partial [Elasticomyces elasticus]